MKFRFSVIRETKCYEEHTVSIDALNETEARDRISMGEGEYESFDRDELEDAQIRGVILKQ